jgi:Fe2+ or Zn2+ uptake regulation protein
MEVPLYPAVFPISEYFGGYPFKPNASKAPVAASIRIWLKRGKQRRAVAQALTAPRTQAELRELASVHAPQIQLRDVWAILQDCVERGLVACLNPKTTIGKRYFWTMNGKRAAQRAFKLTFNFPEPLNWNHYAFVTRAPLRRHILQELAQSLGKPESCTATEIRKSLQEKYPVGINSVLRALQALAGAGLVKRQSSETRKAYRLTNAGMQIHRAMISNVGMEALNKGGLL